MKLNEVQRVGKRMQTERRKLDLINVLYLYRYLLVRGLLHVYFVYSNGDCYGLLSFQPYRTRFNGINDVHTIFQSMHCAMWIGSWKLDVQVYSFHWSQHYSNLNFTICHGSVDERERERICNTITMSMFITNYTADNKLAQSWLANVHWVHTIFYQLSAIRECDFAGEQRRRAETKTEKLLEHTRAVLHYYTSHNMGGSRWPIYSIFIATGTLTLYQTSIDWSNNKWPSAFCISFHVAA